LQGAIVGVEDPQRRFFGLQYHPEVHHTRRGRDMLRHFLFEIAKVPADWKMENVLEEEMAKIAQLVRVWWSGTMY
jgi:GMP synthase (glutamine-hydrolysing)